MGILGKKYIFQVNQFHFRSTSKTQALLGTNAHGDQVYLD